jgi:DNA repair exonuclease SbcCD ATPase subunit
MSEWKLTIENIGVFRGNHVFTFRKGLNVVKAPNTAGKTSLLKALKLLSDVPEEETAQYLNDFEEAGRVTLQNGEKYSVSLTRTKEGVKYLRKDKMIGNGRARDVIFVMEGNPLVAYVERGNIDNIVDWFRRFTDIDRIEAIRDVATNIYRNMRNEYLEKRRVTEATVKEIQKTVDELEEELKRIGNRTVEILANEAFIDVKTKLERIHKEIMELENQKSPLAHKLNETQAEISVQETMIKDEDEEIQELEKTLERKLKEESEGKLKLDNLRRDLDVFADRLKELERDIMGKPEIGEIGLERRVIDLEKTIKDREEILYLDRCPKCGRPIKREDIEKELKNIKNTLSKLRQTLERKRIERTEVKNKILELEAEIKRVTEELVREIRELHEQINYHKKRKANYTASLKQLGSQKRKQEEELSKLEEKINDYRNKERKVMSSVSKKLLDEYDSLLEKKRQKEAQRGLLEQKIISIQRGKRELQILEKRIALLEDIVEYYNEKIQTVKDRMRGEMNKALNEAFELLRLAEFEKIYIDENFELELRRKGGVYTTLDRLSGTERTLVAIVMAFVAKETFFGETPFFLIDEVTNVMDDTRFKNLIDYIKEKVGLLLVTRNAPLVGKPRMLTQKQIMYAVE